MQRFGQLALTALVLGSPYTVQAQTFDEAKQVVVRTADLDLNSPQDAKVLVRRLHTASGQACGPQPDAVDLSRVRVWRACTNDAFDRALASSTQARDALVTAQRSPRRAVAAR